MVTEALEDKLLFSELEAKLPKLAKCFINQGCNMDDYENVSYWKGVKRIKNLVSKECFVCLSVQNNGILMKNITFKLSLNFTFTFR